MKGANLVIRTAVQAGISVCFTNPGTTELPLVNALDQESHIHTILGLFEGVCTGAADGYGRMAERPAMTLLHLGPGLANGVANLHNARRAQTPIVSLVGEHATWHRPYDPLLAMDIESLAATVSGWQRTPRRAEDLSRYMAAAVEAAMRGQIATLIVPQDFQWAEVGNLELTKSLPPEKKMDEGRIEAAAKLLRKGPRCALVLGGKSLREKGLMAAGRIQAAVGCDLICETFPARMERGAGLPAIAKIPYLPEMAKEMLSVYDVLVLAGARKPVAFFGYENSESLLLEQRQATADLCGPDQGVQPALEALAEYLHAPGDPQAEKLSPESRPDIIPGRLDGDKIGRIIAALQPENAVIVEEAVTNSLPWFLYSNTCPRHTLLSLTGGAIGQGSPCAAGAAVACPDRPVINFEADGSAMYTLQALWTQAREHLNVTTLICSNRSYDILKVELARAGVDHPGKTAQKVTDLTGIDWVKLGRAQGVPSVSVETAEDLAEKMQKALDDPGPHLIEMVL